MKSLSKSIKIFIKFLNVRVGEKIVPPDYKLRRVKYLNNVTEQYRRFIKKKLRASQGFKSFYTAERMLEGIGAMNMIRKGAINMEMASAALWGIASTIDPICITDALEAHFRFQSL